MKIKSTATIKDILLWEIQCLKMHINILQEAIRNDGKIQTDEFGDVQMVFITEDNTRRISVPIREEFFKERSGETYLVNVRNRISEIKEQLLDL